jgi:2-oxoisovalerate dehydrogenase E1 component subunit alpha
MMADDLRSDPNATEVTMAVQTLPEAHEVGGRWHPAPPPTGLDARRLGELYRVMVLARRVDRQAINLTKQGELAVFPSAQGQEATEIGAVFALSPPDWLFPTYRDTEAIVARGVNPVEVLAQFRGTDLCGFDPYAARVAAPATPIATQVLHAAGLAMAVKLRGDPIVALAFCGDGATSEGDFHEGLNFASVFGAPCVFVVVNNQYAISVPVARQTHAPTLADKAVGYGMPGARVDGNDVLAVYGAVRAAVERARADGGPTLVECVTYRTEPHTNSDDDSRYRSAEEVASWVDRDPVARFERYLEREGLLDDEVRARVARAADAMAARVREGVIALPDPKPDELFEFAYVSPPPSLLRQREQLRAELARGSS